MTPIGSHPLRSYTLFKPHYLIQTHGTAGFGRLGAGRTGLAPAPLSTKRQPDQQSVSDRRQKRKKLTVLRQGGTVSKCCHEGSVIMAHPEGLTLSEVIRQRRNNYFKITEASVQSLIVLSATNDRSDQNS